jgi:hypothetical protein
MVRNIHAIFWESTEGKKWKRMKKATKYVPFKKTIEFL